MRLLIDIYFIKKIYPFERQQIDYFDLREKKFNQTVKKIENIQRVNWRNTAIVLLNAKGLYFLFKTIDLPLANLFVQGTNRSNKKNASIAYIDIQGLYSVHLICHILLKKNWARIN